MTGEEKLDQLKMFAISSVLLLSSCAVYKAAQNDGVAPSDIRSCATKMCFLAHGMSRVESHKEKNGHYVEIYTAVARKSGLNYVRAAGHGVLDVATLGLWEVAGTPVEGAISNNRGRVTAKATYRDQGGTQLISLEIYGVNGKKIG